MLAARDKICYTAVGLSGSIVTKWRYKKREKMQLQPDLHAPVFFAALVCLVRGNWNRRERSAVQDEGLECIVSA